MTTATINAKLQIVNLKGKKFKAVLGHYEPTGFALYNPELGYFAFEGNDCPYSPVGGKKALQSILDSGGFLDFDTSVWLKELK